jgi:hypothetical protein
MICFFGGDDLGFLKEKVKTYAMAPMWSLNSPSFISVFLHVYSLLARTVINDSPSVRPMLHQIHLRLLGIPEKTITLNYMLVSCCQKKKNHAVSLSSNFLAGTSHCVVLGESYLVHLSNELTHRSVLIERRKKKSLLEFQINFLLPVHRFQFSTYVGGSAKLPGDMLFIFFFASRISFPFIGPVRAVHRLIWFAGQ